jgi:hypothetical protein
MLKSLDQKLAILRANPDANVFILADAKDADLAWGCSSPGLRRGSNPRRTEFRSMAEFREQCRQIIAQGMIDVLLASTSTHALLAHKEKLFKNSPVTPAIRANDTTDVWRGRGARYRDEPSRPFATTFLEEAQWGDDPAEWTRGRRDSKRPVVNLGLYSMTFNNLVSSDLETLKAYKAFRLEAKTKGFRYFLEVFPPNISYREARLRPSEVPGFVNDQIARLLASVPAGMRPEFLKLPYFGTRALAELRNYDASLVIGVLGGSSGTTHDAFKLLADAKAAGARCALFGRRIKDAEDPLAFIAAMRAIVDDGLPAQEAVRFYRGELQKKGIRPLRSLRSDLEITFNDLSFTRL